MLYKSGHRQQWGKINVHSHPEKQSTHLKSLYKFTSYVHSKTELSILLLYKFDLIQMEQDCPSPHIKQVIAKNNASANL